MDTFIKIYLDIDDVLSDSLRFKDLIGSDTLQYISAYTTSVNNIQKYTIPNCDHQLKSLGNSNIPSQLTEYYFFDMYKTEGFPDDSTGINLLDKEV